MQTEFQRAENVATRTPPRALQFIKLEKGKFEISAEAESFFDKLQAQIESDSGKSYFHLQYSVISSRNEKIGV